MRKYALGHSVGLTRCIKDARIGINNNLAERWMRPMALQRKNALFDGHELAAEG